jgi:hypothetical protein
MPLHCELRTSPHSGTSSWLRLSAAEGELSQHNLAVHRQLEEAAATWGQQMADLQAAYEQRIAGRVWLVDVSGVVWGGDVNGSLRWRLSVKVGGRHTYGCSWCCKVWQVGVGN